MNILVRLMKNWFIYDLERLMKIWFRYDLTREIKKPIEIKDEINLRLPDLPMEIIEDIILRLPAKSLVRFKPVSHLWKKIISDPNFGTKHFKIQKQSQSQSLRLLLHEKLGYGLTNFYSIGLLQEKAQAMKVNDKQLLNRRWKGFGLFRVVGSCNGLVLISAFNEKQLQVVLCIWNPSTGECITLPEHDCFPPYMTATYGFGHEPYTDDYKVVCFKYTEFYLYTTRSNSWRWVADIHLEDHARFDDAMLFANSKLCCLTSDRFIPKVICFDLKTEKVSFMDAPGSGDLRILDLWALNGNLCVTTFSGLWVMNDDGVKASWVKMFNIKLRVIPLHVSENGEFLIYVAHADSCSTVVCFNKKNWLKARSLDIKCAPKFFHPTLYVETLLSPKGLSGL